ncbi:MAG: hypothetical protein AB8B57_10770 [Congregibacter sp.]
METRQQRLVRQALEQDSREKAPTSGELPPKPAQTLLSKKSLKRTADDYVPRTLTPHEWETYYREKGIPPSHRPRQTSAPDNSGWLRSLLRRLMRRDMPP